jgi:50S ribosomal protein L5
MAAAKKTQVAKETATEKKPVEMNRVKARYINEVVPYLVKKFNYKNVNQVPKLVKITLNTGLGDVKDNAKSIQLAVEELKTISGQKPLTIAARKSVANFKVREGMTVGAKVTLRGDRMYEFFDKLVSIALPRVRDFRGVSTKSFDGRGNYAMGVKEQLIFPEISYDQVEKIRGFDVCFTTTANTDEEARELLKALGMPFSAK